MSGPYLQIALLFANGAVLTKGAKNIVNALMTKDSSHSAYARHAVGCADRGGVVLYSTFSNEHSHNRGYSAAGSASPWHGEGQGFESP